MLEIMTKNPAELHNMERVSVNELENDATK